MVGQDKPVLSEVERLIPAYNVFLLIEKWNEIIIQIHLF